MKITFFVLMFSISNFAFCEIYCSISGIAKEYGSNNPIIGGKAQLYDALLPESPIKEVTTNTNGQFHFLRVNPGTYFVYIKCAGFAPNFDKRVVREYKSEWMLRSGFYFELKSGENKFISSVLKKECRIEGFIGEKSFNGTSHVNQVRISLLKKIPPQEKYLYSDPRIDYVVISVIGLTKLSSGNYCISGMVPGEYVMVLNRPNYQNIRISVNLTENQIFKQDFTFDLTKNIGIFGTVTIDGKIPEFSTVSVYLGADLIAKEICSSFTGKYEVFFENEGEYIVHFSAKDTNGKFLKKSIKKSIWAGHLEQINLDFKPPWGRFLHFCILLESDLKRRFMTKITLQRKELYLRQYGDGSCIFAFFCWNQISKGDL